MIYIGAEVIVSPLGDSAEDNWNALSENRTGIALAPAAGFNQEDIYLSKISGLDGALRFQRLVIKALTSVQEGIDASVLTSDRTIVLISSTKGALDDNLHDPFSETCAAVMRHSRLAHLPMVISNACISGVLTLNVAGNMIEAGQYEHVIVIGCDVASDFVLYGFQSLFAVSDKPCAPFDVARNGITLGEGCGAVLISASQSVYKNTPLQLLTGTSANDANHISGPSRTGEGLVRSVIRTIARHGVPNDEIDFICAHGTGTVFNDEMESIAFDRLALSDKPLNSLKGYFGHTLGAAGVIETAVCMQMIRKGMLIKSLGYRNAGTSIPLNIILENKPQKLRTVLKNGFWLWWGKCVIDDQGLMKVITAYCNLRADEVLVNGEVVMRRDAVSEDSWFKQIYRQQDLAYPKFYKMDVLSQAGYLASELIKRSDPGVFAAYADDEIALVFANASSSAETDRRFIQSYEGGGSPSPSLFVYTLPNIVLGEIAILNKWYGENMFAVLPKFTPGFYLDYSRILAASGSRALLGGWLEVTADSTDVFLFLVEEQASGIEFNSENLLHLSQAGLVAAY